MDQSKIKRRVVRTIFGFAFAIVFIIFAVISCKVAVHSNECNTEPAEGFDDRNYGYNRAEFLERQPQLRTESEEPLSVPVEAEPEITPQVIEEVQPTEEVPQLSPAALKAQQLGLPAPPEIDINSWEFMLVNADHSIEMYEPESLTTVEGVQVDSRIVEPLNAMAEDSRNQGLSVFLSSGYRSYTDQYNNFLRVCANNGVSDGKDAQGFYITMPAGCSEHQTGLCCDITNINYPIKDRTIENTDLFQYMSKHCQDFGFILRYPDGKESITGVMYEPWHYRYVGVEVAKYIMENNICLEEFLTLYE